jgi:DNA-binding transcriptional MerR regulator
MEKALPSIPAKRYFTIGEVSDLCGVKPYVLRYWEQEFTQLKPMKRRGNRRYYQHHEVLLIRRIRELLYEQGFTISGARNRLTEAGHSRASAPDLAGSEVIETDALLDNSEIVAEIDPANEAGTRIELPQPEVATLSVLSMPQMRQELLSIRVLLGG